MDLTYGDSCTVAPAEYASLKSVCQVMEYTTTNWLVGAMTGFRRIINRYYSLAPNCHEQFMFEHDLSSTALSLKKTQNKNKTSQPP